MMTSKRRKASRYAPLIALAILLVAWAVQRLLPGGDAEPNNGQGLPRNKAWLVYSHHAQCRMQCRRISKAEVEAILVNGKVNYRKSQVGKLPECQRKYALEGRTDDGQRVRICVCPLWQKNNRGHGY
jgi:hypothetical protein